MQCQIKHPTPSAQEYKYQIKNRYFVYNQIEIDIHYSKGQRKNVFNFSLKSHPTQNRTKIHTSLPSYLSHLLLQMDINLTNTNEV